MKTSYTFYNDPGHGWLAVKRAELIELGIAAQITPYSYQRGDTVYLEEDCDASTFLRAKRAQGIECKLNERQAEQRSRIRSYDSYKAGAPSAR